VRGDVRRWLGYLAITLVFAVACSLLGLWQWSRNEQRQAEIALIEANYDADAVPVDELLPTTDAFDAADEWRTVLVTGEYLVDEQLLVRNRPRSGQPGFDVLVPFRTDAGEVLVVDRGWVPTGEAQDSPDVVPAPPSGEVTVEARLRPGEPELANRSAPAGQIATIHLDTVADAVGEPTYTAAYGVLRSEDPEPATTPWGAFRPSEDPGSHLSYTFQWFAFGVLAVIGLVWAFRRERRVRLEESGEIAPRVEPRRRRPSDQEEEDALLDRQLVD
jgi:cytochrome oxidase assembly protein ShyY1